MSSTSETYDQFSTHFHKSFSHEPCIVIDVAQSNLPPSPWSGNNNRNTQICCQAFFDPTINGGHYEIAFYDNGYAYYESLDGERFQSRLQQHNPQMEFKDLRRVLEKMRQILEESGTNKIENQITVELVDDDRLFVDIKGRLKIQVRFFLFSLFFKVLLSLHFCLLIRLNVNVVKENFMKQIMFVKLFIVLLNVEVENLN
jgi:hypothetical protein